MMYATSPKLTTLVEALLYIAHHPPAQPLGGKKLAALLEVSPRYLELLLQELVKEGMLRSVRGPRGGYMLAKERSNILMSNVWLAAKEKPTTTYETTSVITEKLVNPLFERAHAAYLHALASISLEDLCQSAERQRLSSLLMLKKSPISEKLDFSI
jgi:Rrf2 family transcriptional regulator, iron-sulfur cluster assembly transcription factor